ncbi:hypothetical protein RCL1_006014 [Eukaryota sp. TZLM3-RCL]
MKLSPKDYALAFLEKHTPEDQSTSTVDGLWKCKVAGCEKTRMQKPGTGYSNLWSHITSHHPDYEILMSQFNENSESNLERFIVRDMSRNCFYWLDWIMTNLLPFSFADNPINRLYSRLSDTCSQTLLKNAVSVQKELYSGIADNLGSNFALILDGWEDRVSGQEYVALFGSSTSSNGLILLDLVPFVLPGDEDDEEALPPNANDVMFGAEHYQRLVLQVLLKFGKCWTDVAVLVGDNCATNKALADLAALPLVGCASHRWALEMSSANNDLEDISVKIDTFLKILRKKKRRMILRTATSLKPKRRNATRWSSSVTMLRHFVQLLPIIDSLFFNDIFVTDLLPSRTETALITDALEKFNKLDLVTKKLQTLHVPLHKAKAVFDVAHEDFPAMNSYTTYPASIMHSPRFESAVIKVLNGNESQLTLTEKSLIRRFLMEQQHVIDPFNTSFESRLDAKLDENQSSHESKYICLEFIPATSNEAERLFSKARMLMEDRPALEAHNLSLQLFLHYNRRLWDCDLVKKALKNH